MGAEVCRRLQLINGARLPGGRACDRQRERRALFAMAAVDLLAAARARARAGRAPPPPPLEDVLAAAEAAVEAMAPAPDAPIAALPGLSFARLLSPEACARVAAAIERLADGRWVRGKDRDCANFGGRPGDAAIAEPLPTLLALLAARLAPWFGGTPPNHCLVNAYAPAGGLAPHTDGPLYSASATVTLAGAAALDFRAGSASVEADPPIAQLVCQPGDAVGLAGEAYRSHTHALRARAADVVRGDCINLAAAGVSVGDVVARGARRLSLVFVLKVGGSA